jgi:tetratricopeptide (TPR) repeat protein
MKKSFNVAALMLALVCSHSALTQQPANPETNKAPQPAARRVPQAKTHVEFTDYNTAYGITGGAAMEKAADEFAAKYPDSELKVYLYSKAMHEYQNENNSTKMLSSGEKVLQIDPDNSIALVLTANVLADSVSDADTDRQAKIARVRKNSTRALETVDAAFVAPPNATPAMVAEYKSTLRSMAHSALGIAALKTNDDAAAENELKLAAGQNQSQPDPYIWYHLALAQDHQKKYPEALTSINRALQAIGANADLGELARGEQKRLLTLTGGSAPIPAPK